MRVPLTIVPLVEPRSTTTYVPRPGRISAWRRLTFWSLRGTVQSAMPADGDRAVAERDPLAGRQHERAGADAARRLAERGDDAEATRPQVLVGDQLRRGPGP